MISIPAELENWEDKDKFRAFLNACHDEAVEDDHFKIASIALDVRHIDPLAVLESIYTGDAEHFYLEHPESGWAIAGAEAVLRKECSGPERFIEIKHFSDEVLENTTIIGAVRNPFAGPHFFCCLNFYADPPVDSGFRSAVCFVPQWQVGNQDGVCTAVANVCIFPETSVDEQVERIWNAHLKFKDFDYNSSAEPPTYKVVDQAEVGGEGQYQRIVQEALDGIDDGKYDKIVLARALDLQFDNTCQPLRTLNGLRQKFPTCRNYSFQETSGVSIIGATPERLIRVDQNKAYIDAIAGTVARGETASSDASLALKLLESEKDLREHQHVIESIQRRLSSLGLELQPQSRPKLLKLANVQHLYTPLTGDLGEGNHIMDLASVLHPTPAVGGTPRESALEDIRQLEAFPRGPFAGVVGFFDMNGEGELCVSIRSALMKGKAARIFAGAGIVKGSEPENEKMETDDKMLALKEALSIAH